MRGRDVVADDDDNVDVSLLLLSLVGFNSPHGYRPPRCSAAKADAMNSSRV